MPTLQLEYQQYLLDCRKDNKTPLPFREWLAERMKKEIKSCKT